MNYNDREEWILAQGVWAGLAVMAISLGITKIVMPSEWKETNPMTPRTSLAQILI